MIDPRIALAGQVPSVTPAINIFENALMNAQTRDLRQAQEVRAQELAPFQIQKAQQNVDINAQTLEQNRNAQRLQNIHQTGQRLKPFIESGDTQGAQQFLLDNISKIQARIKQGSGEDITESMEVLSKLQSGDFQGVLGDINAVEGLVLGNKGQSSGTREHQNLINTAQNPNSTELEKNAALTALGQKASAKDFAPVIVDIGGVPHSFNKNENKMVPVQVAGQDVTTESVADSKAKIRQAEKFGELTASSRSKAIDKGFDQITKIDLGLSNIGDAIQAVNDGAGTGFINKNFPSIKAASVLLDNIQGRMALDVVGAVTFGALSKGELDLAKMVALPTGLQGPELIKHLQDKQAAQQKLRNYYSEQIEFLDQGGSVAGFLRSKKRELDTQGGTDAQQQPVNVGRFTIEVQ